MEAIAISLLMKLWPVILGIGAVALAYLRGRSTGKRSERNAQAAREAKARDIHDEIQSDVGSMSADHIREELAKRASK